MDFWMLIWVATTSFVVALSGALMPGPLLTLTVGEATRRGFWAGPLIMVGHGLLELVLVVLLLLGAGVWLNRPVVLGTVGLLGAVVLGWMGTGLLRASRHAHLKLDSQNASGTNPVWAGILMSLANPYWLLWWVTIGLGYVMFSAKYGWLGVMLFFVGHILADFAWYSLVSMAVAQGRRWFTDGIYRGFLVGCGVFLIAFGGYFGFQGIGFLIKAWPDPSGLLAAAWAFAVF